MPILICGKGTDTGVGNPPFDEAGYEMFDHVEGVLHSMGVPSGVACENGIMVQ